MKFPSGIRARLTLGIAAYSIMLSLAVAVHGFLFNEQAENLLWESRFSSDFEEAAARKGAGIPWSDSATTRLYGALSGAPIPAPFSELPEGLHDELLHEGKLFVAMVRGTGAQRSVLALDITSIEKAELHLTWIMAASTAAVVLLLAYLTYLATGRLLRPLTDIARDVSLMPVGSGDHQVSVPESAPREAIQIAEAINGHLRRLDRFVVREREFIDTASHELRTPIAVIAGSAEVALDKDPQSPSRQEIRRILTTARDMQDLVALLLTLAKDPRGLASKAEVLDLAALIPAIVDDHRLLAEQKELSLEIDALASVTLSAPKQIVTAAIGNLLRNAIENSNRGSIRLKLTADGAVEIQDPGQGMTAQEVSRIYTRLAREGELSANGIGLELIARMCEHLGWRLDFESMPGSGTNAILIFMPKVAHAGHGP